MFTVTVDTPGARSRIEVFESLAEGDARFREFILGVDSPADVTLYHVHADGYPVVVKRAELGTGR